VPYTKPAIDESGLHIPLYTDIRDDLLLQARQIFGDDIYLDTDSQDYQLIVQFSDKLDDGYKLGQMVYNNRGSGTAIGVGLDGVVKINGLRRKEAGRSQCYVVCAGVPGTWVFRGAVRDKAGHTWGLENFTIPESGSITVLATCQAPGAIYADAGTITKIATQTNGWTGVNNLVNAMVGQPVETDSSLKARQTISTAKPSKTVLLGTMGGIAEIPDVLRSRVYENDTKVFGYYGVPIPENSICAVVEGGSDQAIGEEIHLRKGPGCGTYGDVTVNIESPSTALAPPPPVKFYRPTYVDVTVQITITRRQGFVMQFVNAMKQNIADYLNALEIGTDLTTSALYVPAQSVTPDIHNPAFSIIELLIGDDAGSLSRDDMTVAFNEVTRGAVENVDIIVQ